MDIEKRLSNLENLVNHLSEKIDSYKFYFDADVAGDRQRINNITPYKETKKAYYNESEKTFYEVPQGNVNVYFSNYNGDYSIKRVANRLTVSFDRLTDTTDITISIL